MPVEKLKEFLDQNKVEYVLISHSPAYTAQKIAATAHISGRELAKTVIVKLDSQLAMVVLPASEVVSLEELRRAAGAREVELATEQEFQDQFPGCALGAMPPFGNLYGMPVLVGDSLVEDEEIAFNAGSFTELIRMRYRDFERLVQPKVLHVTARV